MYKAVFVDDELLVLEGLKKIIDWESYGIKVVGCAQSAEDGIVLVEEHNPEILITDIRMRGTDGLEMIEILNKRGYNGYIIILSGYQEFEYARRAIENKVYRYIVKPLDIDEMKRIISDITEELSSRSTGIEIERGQFDKIIEYVRLHFCEEISLSQLANMYHFELSHFSRLFKKHTGKTYSDYIAKMRVDYAKKYLRETDRNIEEITEIVGYKSVKYFRDIFRKYTGVTPSEYRKGMGE